MILTCRRRGRRCGRRRRCRRRRRRRGRRKAFLKTQSPKTVGGGASPLGVLNKFPATRPM